MKKLLTLVLALVLVFAIAAPALAITGDVGQDTTPVGISPVELNVGLLNAAPTYTYAAVITASDVAANKAYIVNEVAFWYVGLNFNAHEANKTTLNMASSDYLGSKLSVSCDAFVPAQTAAYFRDASTNMDWKTATEQLVPNAKKVLEWNVPNNIWDKDLDVLFFGQGIVSAKGVLKAELKKAPVWPLLINKDGKLLYTVYNNPGYFTVVNADLTHRIDFYLNADEEVTKIEVDTHEIKFYVPISGGGSVVQGFTGVDTATEAGKTEFAALNKYYETVMAFFGFDYDAEGILETKHFEAKATGLYLKDEIAVQLYTAAIVIPGGVEPPKTGDASTVIGFVMIAVAMIAAGVVVSRKVRA